MPMQWTKEFETGHQRLDAEHRALFGLIERLQHLIAQGVPLESLEQVLRKLRHSAERHFLWEDQLMTEIGFPGAEAHRALHKMLMASLRDMMQEVSFGSLSPEGLLQFLTNWFATHTSQEDQDLVDYLGVFAASRSLSSEDAERLGLNHADSK
jgi:hemerythrin-like metal-binding protein